MAQQVFKIMRGDTLPAFRVFLKNPDGSDHDASGSTAHTLHVWLSDGTRLVRPLVKIADNPAELGYTFVDADWGAAATADANGAFTVGGFVASPTRPLRPGQREHLMNYEVIGAAGRLTFPNAAEGDGPSIEAYDILRITTDIL